MAERQAPDWSAIARYALDMAAYEREADRAIAFCEEACRERDRWRAIAEDLGVRADYEWGPHQEWLEIRVRVATLPLRSSNDARLLIQHQVFKMIQRLGAVLRHRGVESA